MLVYIIKLDDLPKDVCYGFSECKYPLVIHKSDDKTNLREVTSEEY